ncbi:glycosyltransferase family 2 protein [Candidatus Saccharibacteria bacterium]|nr:glycosyltransferase family 2 protein [Candidatus Saccharibacteria bacterium]
MRKSVLYIVVPCYDEEDCLDETNRSLTGKVFELAKKKISARSRIVYVDDGSKDSTWEKIVGFAKNKKVVGVKLAHNVGHQNALLAGMDYARKKADIIMTIDADLQDDIDAIDKMVEEYQGGAEVVYGVRTDRKADTRLKRDTALGFYSFMKFLGVELVYNAADFRLMSRRAVDELMKYKEVNVFLRGIIPQIGLRSAIVEYKRKKRKAGKSKYPFRKMVHFAWDGVTSFSVKPIRMIFVLGLMIFLLSVGVTTYAVIQKLTGNTVSGWAFTVCSVWMLGGLQMVAIGLVGEYIGKIYIETKCRPKWVVEEIKEK